MRLRIQLLRWLVVALVLVLQPPLALAQQNVEAQELPGFESEGERSPRVRLPRVPDFEPEAPTQESVLPRLELPGSSEQGGIEAGARVRVDHIELAGNTAFSDADLAPITSRFEGRGLDYADLQSLQDELTHFYVSYGYVNSGAVIARQTIRGGVLRVSIVEGSVVAIEIKTDGRLHPRYIRSRLEAATRAPLNVYVLEERLQVLQLDPRFATVDAALVPSDERGRALLRVEVVEANPWLLDLEANNFSSPLVGELRGVVGAGHRNILGFGDSVYVEYKTSQGLDDLSALYGVPFTRWDTRFEFFTRHTWSSVEESPFDALDIESRTQTYGLGIAHPIYRTQQTEVELFVRGEWRRSRATLLGRALPVNSRDDGVNQIAPIRLGASFSHRTSVQMLAARSMLSLGFNILGAITDSGNVPDARFVSWLGQLQFARRLPFLDAELVGRGDLQLASRPLIGIERIGVGGHFSVRGYRENQVVGDNGVAGSLELRIPIPIPKLGTLRTEFVIAPFVDAGHAWNTDRRNPLEPDLVSVGIGGRFRFNERVRMVAYWGKSLIDVDTLGDDSLQQDGVHLGIRFSL